MIDFQTDPRFNNPLPNNGENTPVRVIGQYSSTYHKQGVFFSENTDNIVIALESLHRLGKEWRQLAAGNKTNFITSDMLVLKNSSGETICFYYIDRLPVDTPKEPWDIT